MVAYHECIPRFDRHRRFETFDFSVRNSEESNDVLLIETLDKTRFSLDDIRIGNHLGGKF